jgi:uncharacterized protein involved in exopolysaccharide biosynthesis
MDIGLRGQGVPKHPNMAALTAEISGLSPQSAGALVEAVRGQ